MESIFILILASGYIKKTNIMAGWKPLTSVDEFESFCESLATDDVDVVGICDGEENGGGVDGSLFSDALRTAPTRSLAIRDHVSIRLCANQQAAGPKPLMIFFITN